MPASVKWTDAQIAARNVLAGPSIYDLLEGGSRSGKTFLLTYAVVMRALLAPRSSHAMFRLRFAHLKSSIIAQTFPRVMELCFPEVKHDMNRSDWYVDFPNLSRVWFAGLDEKARVERVLGQEHATLYFNESSQIPYSSVLMALTRLAQNVENVATHAPLRLKAYFDLNPPSVQHWAYQLWHKKLDPESKRPLQEPSRYAWYRLNPADNEANLPAAYLKELSLMPERMRRRFFLGEYDAAEGDALWTVESIDRWRTADDVTTPEMQRIVVAVDPSGASNDEESANDAIGIVVMGLGVDGNAYLLEDLTIKAGPDKWGAIAVSAWERWKADVIVGETNFGGDMVRYVIQARNADVPFKKVTATRGKVVRAEPISALTEQGRIRFAGRFNELEDELCAFTKRGYLGSGSPNRADAFVWAASELFPGIARYEPEKKPDENESFSFITSPQEHAWLG